MTTTFDPVAFKTTTRAQWETAAEAWHRWGPAIENWLGEATEQMLDDVHLAPAPASSTSRRARAGRLLGRPSRRPGRPRPRDRHLPGHPRVRRRGGGRRRADNVEHPRGRRRGPVGGARTASFDAAISRVGLIYFPDQHRALTEICRTLRPGGRLSSVVYSTPDRNGFFSVPVGIIRRIAGLPAPAPGLPGPVQPGRARRGRGGVRGGRAGRRDRRPPFRRRCGMSSAAECVRFEHESFGALHQMLSGRRRRTSGTAAGARSRRRSASSTARTASSGPARCSSSPGRGPDPCLSSLRGGLLRSTSEVRHVVDHRGGTDRRRLRAGLVEQRARRAADVTRPEEAHRPPRVTSRRTGRRTRPAPGPSAAEAADDLLDRPRHRLRHSAHPRLAGRRPRHRAEPAGSRHPPTTRPSATPRR